MSLRMQNEQGGKHHQPHVHAIFSECEAVVALDGTVLEGSLPKSKMKMLEELQNLKPYFLQQR